MDFETVLHQVGDYGMYQKRLLFLVLIPISLILPFASESLLFMLSEPDHWCALPDLSDVSWPDQHLLLRPVIEGSTRRDSCNYYNIDYRQAVGELKQYRVKHGNSSQSFQPEELRFLQPGNRTRACTSWIFDNSSYDANAVTEFQLVCEDRNLKSSILSGSSIAGMVGALFFGYCASMFGRKIMFLFSFTMTYAMLLLQLAFQFKWVFIGSRIAGGFFMCGIYDLSFLILAEMVKPETRSIIIAYTATCWTIGMCLLPLAAALARDWIKILMIPVILMAPFISFIWLMPESPRWLVSKRRYQEAHEILVNIARVNGQPVPEDLMQQLQKINLPRRVSAVSVLNVAATSGTEEREESVNPFEIFQHQRLRMHFVILVIAWISAYSTYGGLTLNFENFEGNEFMNWFLLSLVEFPSNLLSWYSMERIGRRWTTSGSLILGGLALCSPVIMTSSTLILVTSLVGKFLTNIAFNSLFQQAVEVFPTPVRSQAGSYATAIASAATLSLPFLIAMGKGHVWIPLLVIGLISITGGIVTSFLPETLDHNLPQTIADGESLGQGRRYFSMKTNKDKQNRSHSIPRRGSIFGNIR